MPLENSNKSRRLMHTRSIECQGFLRDDGLWEVEAWLRDTKPFTQRAAFTTSACGSPAGRMSLM